jgi:Putative restriction endonuclease
MWKELVIPTIAIEFVSGDGSEERDVTAPTGDSKAGKFWVYEQAIQIPFYAIYEADKAAVEVYELVNGRYQRVAANQRGHYSIAPMGVELGIWQGEYFNQDFPWLRWWDDAGNLLLYPVHFSSSGTIWPAMGTKKPNAIQRNINTEKWLYPIGFYCVVRRF